MIPLPSDITLPTEGLSFGVAPKLEFGPETLRDGRWFAKSATGLVLETVIERRGSALVIRRCRPSGTQLAVSIASPIVAVERSSSSTPGPRTSGSIRGRPGNCACCSAPSATKGSVP